jgi:prepilin-type processing-associated H-X9-DG protein
LAVVSDLYETLEERVAEIDGRYHGETCGVLFFDGSQECNCGLVGAIQDALAGLTIIGRHDHDPGVSLSCPTCRRAEAEYDRMAAR